MRLVGLGTISGGFQGVSLYPGGNVGLRGSVPPAAGFGIFWDTAVRDMRDQRRDAARDPSNIVEKLV